ncbi:MAG: PTS transporter subunit EIIC [Bacillota bacterium]|nr:PTS transporter subunit EIIC [Bacillota bacterium]
MNFMNKFQSTLEGIMGPLAEKIASNKLITAIMSGMMTTLVVTMGVAAISILAAIPFEPWQNFLTSTGIGVHMNAIVGATTSLMAVYIAPAIAYNHAQGEGENGLNAAILSLATFIILQPQTLTVGDQTFNVLQQSYLGSQGIFVAMITGVIISMIYCSLMKKNLKMKLPESVPPMVSNSLSPIFVSMIIFAGILAVRYLIGLTSYGNIFDLLYTLFTKPLLSFAITPWTIILFQTILNLGWFFGIHPAPMLGVLFPILLQLNMQNIEVYMANPGAALPYSAALLIGSFCYLGGQGNTLSLACLLCRAKSEKFKAIGEVGIVPNIFNINEPILFGLPIILNPYFLVPMILTPLVGGVFGMACLGLFGAGAGMNPTVALSIPWVVPSNISAFLIGGFRFGIAIIGAFIIHLICWYPFFKMADKKEYEAEQKRIQEAQNN